MSDRIVIRTDYALLIVLQVSQERLKSNWSVDKDIFTTFPKSLRIVPSFNPDQPNDFAPSLTTAYGRKIGRDFFAYYYSDALKQKGEIWDESTLGAFLLDPDGFAPGTTMILGDRLSPEHIVEIIGLLEDFKSKADAAPKN